MTTGKSEDVPTETVIDASYYANGEDPAGQWRTDGGAPLEAGAEAHGEVGEQAAVEEVHDPLLGVDSRDPRLEAPSRAPVSEEVADNVTVTVVQDSGPDADVVARDQAISGGEEPPKGTSGARTSRKG